MKEKRDITIGFKISESDRKKAESISTLYGHKPGALAGLLLRHFVEAHNTYGERLKFPPAFDYYEEASKITKKKLNREVGIDSANVSSRRKAG